MSQVHLEHRKTLERELRNAGIKPEVTRTDGGHMRILFEAGGKKQSILTSWTPSDHRSTLNARAVIRKILRMSGVLNKAVPVGKLDTALSAPQPTEPFAERIEQLETDVAMLLDMLATVAEKTGVDLEPPEPVRPAPSLVIETAAIEAARHPHSKIESLLSAMTFNWLPVAEIVERSRRERAALVSGLAYAKKLGLVENGQRGMWRKVVGAVAPAGKAYTVPTKGPSKSKVHGLLLNMDYDWLPFSEIVKRESPRSKVAVSVALNTLKKKGLVENGTRGMWRKVAKKANGHARPNGAVHAAI
jgi:hypothetical protein